MRLPSTARAHCLACAGVSIASCLIPQSSAIAQVPPGTVRLTASDSGFSTTQGSGGWFYKFDTGQGTPIRLMDYYVSEGASWCTTSYIGPPGGSYCQLGATGGHPSTPGNCTTFYMGLQRPIREWHCFAPLRCTVRLRISTNWNSPDLYFELKADDVVKWSQGWSWGVPGPADVIVDVGVAQKISLMVDGGGNNCNADGFTSIIEVFVDDCDGNGIADPLEIVDNPNRDSDHDWQLDCCELGVPCSCAGDLFDDDVVNGADLGILLAQWGVRSPSTVSDLNNDGLVNGADLGILLTNWGPCP